MEETREQADQRLELARAQQQYCEQNQLPMFVSITGNCWGCGKDMTDESWRDTLQTGCRHCHRSYCD